MPRLDFYADCKPFLSVRLQGADEIVVGRAPDATVQLPGEEVSRHHARIVPTGSGHALVDLSRNGTRVNSAWVRDRRALEPGDRVYIGGRVFIYQPDEAPVEDLERDLRTAEV
jgi:pSer/pThr/pTyr-binding forkhead associated (FHA) protein